MKEEDIVILVKYRMEQAQQSLEDAKFLLAGKRSVPAIVNRSYYAMFYAAMAILQKNGQVPSKHTGMLSLFDREFIQKGIFPKELSKDLHRTFELRQVVDYKITEEVTLEKAEEILAKAGHFVAAVIKHLAK